MRLSPWVLLPIFSFLPVEIFHFFVNLTSIQWFLLLGIATLCLITFRRRVRRSTGKFIKRIKYFNLRTYRRKLSRWARENDADAIGKSLVSRLERNTKIKLGCITLSMIILKHYPILLTNPTSVANFLKNLTIYLLLSLAFRRELLIEMVGIYVLIAVCPYIMLFMSHDTGINMFETQLAEPVYLLLDIDVANLTQAANKLFFFMTPGIVLRILFLVLSSVIIRSFLKLIFTVFIKTLPSL